MNNHFDNQHVKAKTRMLFCQDKLSASLAALLCIFLFVFLFRCNKVDNSVSTIESTFINNDTGVFLRSDYFYLLPSDSGISATFTGTRICSLFTNNKLLSSHYDTAITAGIYNNGDTIMTLDGVEYGLARFVSADIANWNLFVRFLRDSTVGTTVRPILRAFIAPSSLASIDSLIGTTPALSTSLKQALVSGLNSMIMTDTLYIQFKNNINQKLDETGDLFNFSRDRNRLVDQGIFTDTNGTVKANLASLERERLRWFYFTLFRRYLCKYYSINSLIRICDTITPAYKLFSLSFKTENSVTGEDKFSVTRYIGMEYSQTTQIALRYNGRMMSITDRVVAPYPVRTSLQPWTSTPLYWPSLTAQTSQDLSNMVLACKATAKYLRNISTSDTSYYLFSFRYPVAGTQISGGQPVSITGSIFSTVTLYVYGIGASKRSYWRKWNTETSIHTTGQGIDTLIKESLLLTANPVLTGQRDEKSR